MKERIELEGFELVNQLKKKLTIARLIIFVIVVFLVVTFVMNYTQERKYLSEDLNDYAYLVEQYLSYSDSKLYLSDYELGFTYDLQEAGRRLIRNLNLIETDFKGPDFIKTRIEDSFVRNVSYLSEKRTSNPLTSVEKEYLKGVGTKAKELSNFIKNEYLKIHKNNLELLNTKKMMELIDEFNDFNDTFTSYGFLPGDKTLLTDSQFIQKAKDILSLKSDENITTKIEKSKDVFGGEMLNITTVSIEKKPLFNVNVIFDTATGELINLLYNKWYDDTVMPTQSLPITIQEGADALVLDDGFPVSESQTFLGYLKRLFLKAYGNELTYKLKYIGKSSDYIGVDVYEYQAKWYYHGYPVESFNVSKQSIFVSSDEFEPIFHIGERNIYGDEIRKAIGEPNITISKEEALRIMEKRHPNNSYKYQGTVVKIDMQPREIHVVHKFSYDKDSTADVDVKTGKVSD